MDELTFSLEGSSNIFWRKKRFAMSTGAPFNNVNFLRFPVRAALEIGCGGLATLVVARVDAKLNAIKDMIFETQVPVHLKVDESTGELTETSLADVRNKLLALTAAAHSYNYGVAEMAGLLTWPFSSLSNKGDVLQDLVANSKINLKLLSSGCEEEELVLLAFRGHAAAAKCLKWENMLLISESQGDGKVEIVGVSPNEGSIEVQRYTVPLIPVDVHRLLLREIQKRPAQLLHDASSPNPVLRGEAVALRKLVSGMLEPTVPEWVVEKSSRGGVICGSSYNGGVLNIGARITARSMVPLEHLDLGIEHQLCGLTDVLIGHNFPTPHLIVPQAVFCSCIMRCLKTPRVHYLHQASIAQAILIDPSYWVYSRKEELEGSLGKARWFSSSIHRSYPVPFQSRAPLTPNAPPNYEGTNDSALAAEPSTATRY